MHSLPATRPNCFLAASVWPDVDVGGPEPRLGRPPSPQGDDGMVKGRGGTAGLYAAGSGTLQLLVDLPGDTRSMEITDAPQCADHVPVASEPERGGEGDSLADSWMPGAIIARLMNAVPPGSYLTISQIAGDIAADEVAEGVQRYNQQATAPVAARTHAEVSRYFAGLDLVEPGVVQGTPVAGPSRRPGQRPRPGHLCRSRAETVTAGRKPPRAAMLREPAPRRRWR
jgi:S-adenosyl methyltransferase